MESKTAENPFYTFNQNLVKYQQNKDLICIRRKNDPNYTYMLINNFVINGNENNINRHLFNLKGIGVRYLYHSGILGYSDPSLNTFTPEEEEIFTDKFQPRGILINSSFITDITPCDDSNINNILDGNERNLVSRILNDIAESGWEPNYNFQYCFTY